MNVEERSDAEKRYGSPSAVDLGISVNEVHAEGHCHKNSVADDKIQMDLDQIVRKESPYVKSHPETIVNIYDQESIHPAFEDDDYQGEMDELTDNYFHKSSYHSMEKSSHDEVGSEDSTHSQESPMRVNDIQRDKMEGVSNFNGSKTTDVVEESKPEEHSYPEEGELPFIGRQSSVSPERSQYEQSTHNHRPLSSEEDAQEPSRPPTSTRANRPSSHQRSSRHRHGQSLSPKESGQIKVPPRDHISSFSRKETSSPSKSRNSPKKYGRRDRSVSRSPVRQRDSSSRYKGGLRHRSRSRSPYKREYHRSYRGRYSPRQRSPVYHSSRHSPRRKPWAPPANRKTGLGEPGNNLFVAGFSFPTTERDLERKFSRFGRVREIRIVRDKRSGASRGFGFLTMEKDEDADEAIRALDETEWDGRIILVEKTKSH